MSRNLSREEIIDVVTEISEEIAEDLDMEIVEVQYGNQHGQYVLTVLIWKKDGVSIDDCETMTRLLSDAIDERDPIPGAYTLEVSSSGLDRPIESNADLNRSMNEEIEVRLYKHIDDRKIYEGELIDYTDEDITIQISEDEEKTFPRDLIALMRLVIKF